MLSYSKLAALFGAIASTSALAVPVVTPRATTFEIKGGSGYLNVSGRK
jgi:hypothetical protein